MANIFSLYCLAKVLAMTLTDQISSRLEYFQY